ncbi:sugar ABC transporter permease [Microbacterium sp. Y-01]|nr:sugar ABC transporter permease [Microbacterium sp. Y-01]
MLLPLLVGTTIFYFYPILRTLLLSFMETGAFRGESWSGLTQYQRLWADEEFWRSLGNSGIYAAISIIGIPLALVIAVLLNRNGLRFKGAFRVLYFLPVVTLPVAVGMMWSLLLNGDFGLLNQLLRTIGIEGMPWLADRRTALVAVALVGVWATLGQNIVILLAGLQGIPREYREAAWLDGAGPIREFRSITVPLVTPTLFFVTVITLINSMQAFDLIYIMVGADNPAISASQTVVYYFFKAGFLVHDRAYAATIACALMIVVLALTAIQFRLQRKWVHYA